MLHRHVKILMFDLYDMFDRVGIFVEIFMPYYLSMFACVVDYQFMVFVSLFLAYCYRLVYGQGLLLS